MGQDFRAILSHQLTQADFVSLTYRLDTMTDTLSNYLAQTRLDTTSEPSGPSGWRWGWSESNQPDLKSWSIGEPLALSGIGSMTLDLGRHCVKFGCWVRWVEFVRDKTIQKPMREIVLRFANIFRSELAIYVPGSSSKMGEGASNRVYDGLSFEEILDYLAQHQAPASSIDSICKPVRKLIDGKVDEVIECDGYYIDRFKDLI